MRRRSGGDISSTVGAGFELVRFEHEALPELDLEEIDTTTDFLGTDLALPLMISCMTGGTHQGRDANRDLAIAAQACGVAVGLGSMRVGLENPTCSITSRSRPWLPTCRWSPTWPPRNSVRSTTIGSRMP